MELSTVFQTIKYSYAILYMLDKLNNMKGLYNTYVIDTDNFKAVKRVASGVDEPQAREMEHMVGKNYNSVDHFVQSYEIGSDRDNECTRELKKLERSR